VGNLQALSDSTFPNKSLAAASATEARPCGNLSLPSRQNIFDMEAAEMFLSHSHAFGRQNIFEMEAAAKKKYI
jgi:predicted outer membrane protein